MEFMLITTAGPSSILTRHFIIPVTYIFRPFDIPVSLVWQASSIISEKSYLKGVQV